MYYMYVKHKIQTDPFSQISPSGESLSGNHKQLRGRRGSTPHQKRIKLHALLLTRRQSLQTDRKFSNIYSFLSNNTCISHYGLLECSFFFFFKPCDLLARFLRTEPKKSMFFVLFHLFQHSDVEWLINFSLNYLEGAIDKNQKSVSV